MNSARPGRAILGGFLATVVMTILIYAAPMLGLHGMDIAGMLGSMMSGTMPPAGTVRDLFRVRSFSGRGARHAVRGTLGLSKACRSSACSGGYAQPSAAS